MSQRRHPGQTNAGRFWLLLGLLFAVVAGATFLAVTLILESDDDDPAADASTSTTVGITTTTTTGELTTPSFVAVVVSEPDEATARATADELTESGFDSGVLHSDDYSSLNPGFWVAYVGPFDDVGGAQGAVSELEGAGYTASYSRCIGTDEECS
jgi:SPOR domain